MPARGFGQWPIAEDAKRQFSNMYDMVYDLPLPWDPQMKVDQGVLVLKKIGELTELAGRSSEGNSWPSTAYCSKLTLDSRAACLAGQAKRGVILISSGQIVAAALLCVSFRRRLETYRASSASSLVSCALCGILGFVLGSFRRGAGKASEEKAIEFACWYGTLFCC